MTQQTPAPDRRGLLQNALHALEDLQARLDRVERARTEPIAVVGMGCRFPGGANDPAAFWQLLQHGVDAVSDVGPERWDAAALAALPAGSGTKGRWFGGFLPDLDRFDARFFGIAPREAVSLDPQQRLVLEVSWEALEQAGLAPDRLAGSLTGVFVGITTNDYARLSMQRGADQLDVYTATGGALNAAAGRVSYTLGLRGPSVAVDTACSSSLVAVHLACQSLRTGDSDLALAGGVNALIMPEGFAYCEKWGMLAADGRCKTFDARADGFVRGEGCGMVVLKRLSDALADGDSILALIRGSAVNQDGRSSGLTVPNGLAQQEVIRKALANAGVEPAAIGYVEAHGTGTSLGDPIEVEALGAVLGSGRSADRPLVIGSVKTNFGHLESASGIAGLMKAVLCLQHEEIPPHLHLRERSPRIPWPAFPIEIPRERMSWPDGDGSRLACVSSFGLSGTNAHVVLEQAPPRVAAASPRERPRHLLALSAKSAAALQQLASRYYRYLDSEPTVQLADVAYSANTGRAHFAHRVAVSAETTGELRRKLEALARGGETSRSTSTPTDGGAAPRVAFLFPGQGAQYVGMGRQLYETQPTFRSAVDRCDALLRPYLEQPLLSVLYPDGAELPWLDETAYTQPALFAIEYALAELWRSWGIEPTAVLGHSVGGYAAACVAGVFSLADALKLIATRGRLMQALPRGGAMAAILGSAARVAAAVVPHADAVAIAAVNGPNQVVISGTREGVEAIVTALASDGLVAKYLTVSHAFHSPLVEPMLAEYERAMAEVALAAPRLCLVSELTGQVAGAEVTRPDYWRRQAREPVQFAAALATLQQQRITHFLELGPQPILLGMARDCLSAPPGGLLTSLRRGRDDWAELLDSLAALYESGADPDWKGFDRDYARQRVTLPTYPFQRERYWLAAREQVASAPRLAETTGTGHPLLGRRIDLAPVPGGHVWETTIGPALQEYLDHSATPDGEALPLTACLELAAAAARELWGASPLAVLDVQQHEPLKTRGGAPLLQLVLSAAADGQAAFSLYSCWPIPGAADRPNGDWTLHASGRLRRGQDGDRSQPFALSELEAIRRRCDAEIVRDARPHRASESNDQQEPRAQGAVRTWRGTEEALALVSIPSASGGHLPSYQLHPILVDAGVQMLLAALPAVAAPCEPGERYVVERIAECRLHQPVRSGQLWVHARLCPPPGPEATALVGDVRVVDDAGALAAELRDVCIQRRDAAGPAALPTLLDDCFYGLEWRPAPLPATTPATHGGNTWLIFADGAGVGQAVAASLEAQGARCILVSPADEYARLAADRYRIDPSRPADFQRLVDDALGQEACACQGVLHCWSLDARPPTLDSAAALDEARVLGCESALHLVQALAESPWRERPRLWLVTRGAQAVGETPVPLAIEQAPLWGFGRALAFEHPELWGGLVDLDPLGETNELAASVLAELGQPRDDDQVAFRQGKRLVARLARWPEAGAATQQGNVRGDATYLITGGLGGLGLAVAQWLVARGARYLALMGRRGPTDRAQDILRALEQAGARVAVLQGDVSRGEDIAAALAEIGRTMPRLRGVIHAAGVLDDGLLQQQTGARFARVMAPKVAGAWHLDRLTREAPLDFFVLFSSASVLLGSAGQANYAAGNAFLDALAHQRKWEGQPGLSVNWGAWAEVGMAAELERSGNNTLAGRGVGALAPRHGLEALGRLLNQERPQVGVMSVNWARWQQLSPFVAAAPVLSELMGSGSAPILGKPGLTREAVLAADPAARCQLLEDYFTEQAAGVLGLAQTEVEPDQPLTDLGLDSLMAVELKNRIEGALGVAPRMVEFLAGISIRQLAAHALDRLLEATAEGVPATIEAESRTSIDTVLGAAREGTSEAADEAWWASVDQLSAEQVDALLRRFLGGEQSAAMNGRTIAQADS